MKQEFRSDKKLVINEGAPLAAGMEIERKVITTSESKPTVITHIEPPVVEKTMGATSIKEHKEATKIMNIQEAPIVKEHHKEVIHEHHKDVIKE